MNKQQLNKTYATEALNLWRIAFAGDAEFETDFTMKFFLQDDLWGHSNCWLDKGKLVTTYFSLNVDLLVRGKPLTGRYIDGIATLPEYQRRGLVTKCMTDDITSCFQKGIDLMLVDPSRDSFYRQVGFEFAIDKYRASVNLDFFKTDSTKTDYHIKVDTLASKTLQGDYKAINSWLWEHSRYNEMKWSACYEDIKFARNDISLAIAYDKNLNPKGYMLYEPDDNIYIMSIRYTCLEALDALRHHITKLPNLKYCNFSSLPPDFPLEFLVKEMSRPEEAIKSIRNNTRMARIINFSNLLEKLIVQPPKTPVTIQVKDELIPQNNGFFSVSPEGQVQHKTNTEDDFITIDIRDTAPLLCGMTSAEELYYSGRISISSSQNTTQSRHQLPDPIKTLATMLPKTVTYNPDEYLAP